MLTHAGICMSPDNSYSNSSIKNMKVQFVTVVTLPGDTRPCIFIEGILSTPTLPQTGEFVNVPDEQDQYSFFKRGLHIYSTDFGSYEVVKIDHLLEKRGILRPRINFEVNVNYGYELECDWERLSLLSSEHLKVYLSGDAVDTYMAERVKKFGYQYEEADELIRQLTKKLPSV